MKLSYLNLTTTDPAYNLAMEQYVFDSLPRDRAYFMLWQNDNAIIIGKYQNTLAEINQSYVEQHGIHVVRRLSGGGAVYHDLGNLNFTFIMDAGESSQLNFKLFCLPVVRALERIGIHAEINGRNDMTIDGKKFSGNAQYLKNGRVMHHGTIMFRSDLSVVSQALQVDQSKIQAKGIKSVRSRVTNVCEYLTQEISLPEFRQVLLKSILEETPGDEYVLTEQDLAAVEALREQRYAAWEWNYGASPVCTLMKKQRFEGCGTVEAYISVANGLIDDVEFRGDFFSPSDPHELAAELIGLRPEVNAYAAALQSIDISHFFTGLNNEQFLEMMCS